MIRRRTSPVAALRYGTDRAGRAFGAAGFAQQAVNGQRGAVPDVPPSIPPAGGRLSAVRSSTVMTGGLRPSRARKRWVDVPFMVWAVLVATLVANTTPGEILGYNVSGFAWLIPFVLAILFLLKNLDRVTLPVYLWIPWIGVVVAYFCLGDAANALQRSAMILCPLVVGAAVSASRATEASLAGFVKLTMWLGVAIAVAGGVMAGLFRAAPLASFGRGATVGISCAVLAAIFATLYASGTARALPFWLLMAAVPFVLLTRMPMVATGLTLPLTLGPLSLRKRALALAAMLVGGAALFYTPRFQERMFYSGEGTLGQVSMGNHNFATNGRRLIWDVLERGIAQRPFLGHGANASEAVVQTIVPGLEHPHNDWLRLLYEYGYLGTGVFVVCLVLQFFHLLAHGRKSRGWLRVLFLAGASTFVPFLVIMVTDNVILYAAFFGNLQFALFGLTYAVENARNAGAERQTPARWHGREPRRRAVQPEGRARVIGQSTWRGLAGSPLREAGGASPAGAQRL